MEDATNVELGTIQFNRSLGNAAFFSHGESYSIEIEVPRHSVAAYESAYSFIERLVLAVEATIPAQGQSLIQVNEMVAKQLGRDIDADSIEQQIKELDNTLAKHIQESEQERIDDEAEMVKQQLEDLAKSNKEMLERKRLQSEAENQVATPIKKPRKKSSDDPGAIH